MAHSNFVISQNAKWGHAGFYIDCHRMTVPENILLQKSTEPNPWSTLPHGSRRLLSCESRDGVDGEAVCLTE